MSYSYDRQSPDFLRRLIARVRQAINDIGLPVTEADDSGGEAGVDYFAPDEDVLNALLEARWHDSLDVLCGSSSGTTLGVAPLGGPLPSGVVIRFWSDGETVATVTTAEAAEAGDAILHLTQAAMVPAGAWGVAGSGVAHSWDVSVLLAGAALLGALATNQAYVLKKGATMGEDVDGPAVADSIRKDAAALKARAAAKETDERSAAAVSTTPGITGSVSVPINATW